jgi:hypothetical protein
VTKNIVSGALIEGAALFAAVAYLVEGATLGLVVAPVMIVLLALHVPSQGRLDEWVQQQLERAVHRRQFGV